MNTPHDYDDIDTEAARLLYRAAGRIAEKDDEYGGPEWRNTDPAYHLYRAFHNLGDVSEAFEDGTAPDYDEMQEQAADALNHLCMALSNIETEARREDRS